MAKRKNGPALLELMQREQEDAANQAASETEGRKSWLNRGSWGRRAEAVKVAKADVEVAATVEPMQVPPSTSEPPPELPIVEDHSAVEDEPAVPPPIVEAIPSLPVQAQAVESFEPPPVFQVEDGRVLLSLNPVSSVVAGGGVLLAIFAGFVLGRVTAGGVTEPPEAGPAAAVSPIEEAVKGPANPMVLDDPTGERTEPTERKVVPAPAAPEVVVGESTDPREPGKNYFLLMTAKPDHRTDAEDARNFLTDRGVEAWIVQKDNRWLVFDVTRGFTRRELDSPAYRQRKQQLKRLGVQFFKANLSYNFDPYAVKAPDR